MTGAPDGTSTFNLTDEAGPEHVLFQLSGNAGSGRDQSLDLEFVCIGQEPYHRLLVARIPSDIG